VITSQQDSQQPEKLTTLHVSKYTACLCTCSQICRTSYSISTLGKWKTFQRTFKWSSKHYLTASTKAPIQVMYSSNTYRRSEWKQFVNPFTKYFISTNIYTIGIPKYHTCIYLFIYFPQSYHLNLKTHQHTKIQNMNCFPWLILMFNVNQSKVTTSSIQFSPILNLHVPLCSLLMWLTLSHKLNTLACYLGYECMNRCKVQLQSIWIYELSTSLVQQAEIKYIYVCI